MTLEITYKLTFDIHRQEVFNFVFDEKSMTLQTNADITPEPWTALEFQKCRHCPLDANKNSQCPAAVALQSPIDRLGSEISYKEIDLEVINSERKIKKKSYLSSAFASMMGLLIPASGCPYAEPFKPMARFHLPLASSEETAFRSISAYLFGQYLRRKHGLTADFNLQGLTSIYADIEQVNAQLAIRLVKAGKLRELNSLVKLDTHAKIVPMVIDELGSEFEELFESYLRL